MINVHNLNLFKNFVALCASRTGQLLNLNNIASECGIAFTTAKSWLSILESSYIVFLLQPYYENFAKRIIKSPKLYFYDTGLVAYLLGLRTKDQLLNPALRWHTVRKPDHLRTSKKEFPSESPERVLVLERLEPT